CLFRKDYRCHNFTYSWLVFQIGHFCQTPTKTCRAAESHGEKCLQQFPRDCVTDYEAAKTDHVQIVVLDTLMRRKFFMNQAGPNSCHFICADRCPDTAAANAH